MKKLFFSLVALTIATVSYSQSSMLATLSHDGEISTFYGATALKSAFEAASDGDVITLSSGSFNAIDLTKSVTIRGAGMAIDSLTQAEPTVITGDFKISIPDSVSKRLTLEGIYNNQTIKIDGTLNNATFLKSRFNKIEYINDSSVNNLTMIHCRVSNGININKGSASIVNSLICNPEIHNQSNIEYINSIVIKTSWYRDFLGYSQFKNCILVALGNSSNYLEPANIAYNCVAVGNTTDMFKNIPNTTNKIKSYDEIFKTYTGSYNDNELFELTDDAVTTLLGLDGTQVGIYGGNLPYSSTPTNPQITKCNVAAKSTADGKLSVDITVNGAE